MSPYSQVSFEDLDPLHPFISQAREMISLEIEKHPRDKLMLPWFSDKKWRSNQFSYSTLAWNEERKLIGMSSCRVMDDESMKILCHYYLMKDMRTSFRSISQTDFVPRYVQEARRLSLKSVWMSVHTFDRRHTRLADSIERSINREGNNRISRQQQPYVDHFKYVGEVEYNNTLQKKYVLNLAT